MWNLIVKSNCFYIYLCVDGTAFVGYTELFEIELFS